MEDRVTKKVVIDPYRGGEDIGSNTNGIVEKDYNLEISKYIYDRLRSLGVPVALTRDMDETLDMNNRVRKIKSLYGTGNDVIVLSNALTSGGEGAEIVYALRNSSALAEKIANEIEKVGAPVEKFYQRRLPSDTSKDYNQLIRDTANNESLILYYGNIDNREEAEFLKNHIEDLGEAVVIALANYLNVDYKPVSGSNYYIVKKGDSLYSIALKNNTTVDELKSLNNLATNNLSIGQVLKLPTVQEKPVTPGNEGTIVYTVKSGDSLYSIARKYNTTVDAIRDLNHLMTDILSIGQILKIPGSSSEEPSVDYQTYVVKSGDSLYSIAKQYNTTVDILKNLNGLSSNLLSIGQILKVPATSGEEMPSYLSYQVASGDSLYSIARRYNTTVDAIKTLNNLTSDFLRVGQTLKIPTSHSDSVSQVNYITYKVVSGDSLYSIARRYNTTIDAIKALNNLTNNLLSLGQTLKIPQS